MVGRAFLKLFMITLFGFPILIIVGDLTEKLDSYLRLDLSTVEIVQAYLYQLPQFILWSFPMAALVAAVFTVNSMTQHREIVAMKAGGVSFHRLIAPLLALGAVLTLAALVATDLAPRGNRRASEIRKERTSNRGWRGDFVYEGEGGRTITASRLSIGEGRIHRIGFEKGDPLNDSTPVTHIVAEFADYIDGQGWTFRNGYLRHILPRGELSTFRFDSLRTRGFAERPLDLLERPAEPELMTHAQISRLVGIMQRSGGNPREFLVKREQRIALAVATLIVILFGAPLATTSERGGAAFGIGVSLGTTILYLVFFRLSGAVGEAGGLDPVLAAWLPNGIFLAVGVVLLRRVRT